MRLSANPGSLLEVEGSFELSVSVADILARPPAPASVLQQVRDRESGREITLADLLRSFLQDPADVVTGPIRIRIEAAGAFGD